MDPYQLLEDHYETLFPCPPETVSSILPQRRTPAKAPTVLDVGCATGELCRMLCDSGCRVVGVDTSESLIVRARQAARVGSAGAKPTFRLLDIAALPAGFASGSMDAIACLGNTIAHLSFVEQVRAFLVAAKGLLAHDGILTLQFIDYSERSEGDVWNLPSIELPNHIFERSNRFSNGRIEFLLSVTNRATGESRHAIQQLLPLGRRRLIEWASASGLSLLRTFAAFDDDSPAVANGSGIVQFAHSP